MRRERFGPVTYYQLQRSILGRRVIGVGLYTVGELLVDTGPVRCAGAVREVIESAELGLIVLTHHHEDHVGNAAAAAERIGSRPRIHAAGIELVANPPELPFYRSLVWGRPDPVEAVPLGDTLETERYRFRVIHTPGHAPDHVALHEPELDWLFVGDLYLGDRVRMAFDYEDVGATIDSIRRLLSIPDCVLFCQHSGAHAGHQQRLGRKLDFLLGLEQRAVMHHEEGCSIREITRRLEIRDWGWRLLSGGEWSGDNLVRGLLRHAGKLD